MPAMSHDPIITSPSHHHHHLITILDCQALPLAHQHEIMYQHQQQRQQRCLRPGAITVSGPACSSHNACRCLPASSPASSLARAGCWSSGRPCTRRRRRSGGGRRHGRRCWRTGRWLWVVFGGVGGCRGFEDLWEVRLCGGFQGWKFWGAGFCGFEGLRVCPGVCMRSWRTPSYLRSFLGCHALGFCW